MISRKDVQKLADLVVIDVQEKELDTLASEMEAILGYVSDVTKLSDTKEGMQEKPVLRNVMREDVITNKPGEYSEAILDQAPDRDNDYLRVKKIL